MCGIFEFLKRKEKGKPYGKEHETTKFTKITWMELLQWTDEKARKEIRKNLEEYFKKIKKMDINELTAFKKEVFNSTQHMPIPPSIVEYFPFEKVGIAKFELIKLFLAVEKEIQNKKSLNS